MTLVRATPMSVWHPLRTLTVRRSLYVSRVLRSDDETMTTRIKEQLKTAMRAKDSFASTVYRSLLSEHQYAVKGATTSSSDVSTSVMPGIVQKALAKRQESSRQFRAAKPPREDLAEKEDREASLIRAFLPEQITQDELHDVVRKAIDEAKQSGAEGKRLMGEVMKRVTAQLDKSRAPGAMVSEAVKGLLETK